MINRTFYSNAQLDPRENRRGGEKRGENGKDARKNWGEIGGEKERKKVQKPTKSFTFSSNECAISTGNHVQFRKKCSKGINGCSRGI